MKLIEETPYRFRIEKEGAMRVPGIVFASRALLPGEHEGMALTQVANVATLPGIVRASFAMPDVHWGIRLSDRRRRGNGHRQRRGGLARRRRIRHIVRRPAAGKPGTGPRPPTAPAARTDGRPRPGNTARRRHQGCVAIAQSQGVTAAATVSDRAVERGLGQIGSLGSGNHFLEVRAVDRIYERAAAQRMGLAEGTVCVMIHTGSRGLGHQICTDHVHQMEHAMRRFRIEVYDVSHNLAKLEKHSIDGRLRTVCVHRKGATRSLPPHNPDVPAELSDVGQPVLTPGTMGTASLALAGVPDNPAFFSTAHGAGRVQSRHQAARHTNADVLRRDLEHAGILVRGSSRRGLAEEKPEAYKDIDAVVETSHRAGLARKVARLIPLGVIKG